MFHHDSNTLPEEGAAPKHSLFRVENFEIIFVALTGLSLIGVGITDFSPAHSYWYWFAMAPIFCRRVSRKRMGQGTGYGPKGSAHPPNAIAYVAWTPGGNPHSLFSPPCGAYEL
jgi:hypothetical protein